MPTLPRISTLAKTHHIEQATYYQYIRRPRNPATLPYATMQHYFNALARATFKDTRPQDIIELDTTLDAANLPRIWFATNSRGPSPDNLPELRKWKWHISIPYSTQTLYLAIADHYRITPKHPNPTPLIRTMAVLEAIGQQNLTPIDLPIATHKYPVRYDPNYPSRSWPSIAIYPAGGGPR